MKVAIDKLSNGMTWTFRPTSKGATRLMRKLFKGALWSGNGTYMFVEHRYEVEVAERLVEQGVSLVRESDGAKLRVAGGCFVLEETLQDVLRDIEETSAADHRSAAVVVGEEPSNV